MVIALRPLLALLLLFASSSWAMSLEEAQTALSGRDFQAKGEAIAQLARSDDPSSAPLLAALSRGDLFYVKKGGQLVVRTPEGYQDLAGQPLTLRSSQLKRVVMNNNLRRQLSQSLAERQLGDADSGVRLAAAKELLGKLDDNLTPLLQAQLAKETDDEVKTALAGVLAYEQLKDAEPAARLTAVETLSHWHHPQVLAALQQVRDTDADKAVRLAAGKAAGSLEHTQSVYSGLETLFFGLSLGSVLVLAGIGLAITFGVMGVINMAHGELMMLGAYTTFVMQKLLPDAPGLALLLSIPMAFLVAGAVGVVIERCVIRFLYGRPLETLLATFGLSLLLQQAVRSIFSPLNQSVVMPSWMSGSLFINDFFSLTLNRLVIIAFSLLVFAGLMLLLKRSRLGLEVRAVAQNRAMARNMGVRSARVNALTFGLGSGVAGIAGVALSQLTNVGPNLGQSYIIDAFMVVVFGGVGNLWGTLVAGLTLGVANKLLEPFAGAVLAKILILVAIILFIQKRPRGLFPQRGRAVEG
ncbi:urea ABC transporter permease subunit UrtB [Pseudaeromonas paramecii]|uniref:Urea ABC transporter permease subunit UrtB n=1 Tax=Pseudaeromonas paramecii TaxID=2138166 RepID=A0ABP8PUU4_9GAMM